MPQTDRNNETRPPASDSGGVPLRPTPFRLVQIEKTLVPEGGVDRTWYRYVLENSRSTITGQRCGTLKDVTAYATLYAEQLNARGLTGHSAWSPRAKKPVVGAGTT